MPTREGTFYSVWPVLDGKAINLQWGQIRSNQAELKAIVRNSVQELGSGDELNALRSLLGQEYGDLAFRNKFRFFYDAATEEICCQTNDGTVATPVWTDAWCVRHHDGQFQVVSTGGIYSSAGFYSDDDSLKSMKEIGETGTVANSTVLNPVRLFFNADDGFAVTPIASGANRGAPEITFTQPFGKAEVFTKAGKEWEVNHAFGITPVLAQVMDADGRIVIPDTVDVSDPNVAHFYFNEPFTGSVYIASGGLGAASLVPRDPFYMVIRHDNQSRAGQTFSPNVDLIFDVTDFYVNVDLDSDGGGAHKSARISLTDAVKSPFAHHVRMDDSLSVENTVTAEAFYLTPGSGGEISKSGNDLLIKSRTGQVIIDDELLVSGKLVAEAFYTKDGGEAHSLMVREADGTPSVPDVRIINVSNASLTNNGNGEVTLDFASAEVGARFSTVTAEGFYVQGGGEWDNTGIQVADGTAPLPAISFVSEADTGIYRPTANELAISVSGTQRAVIGKSGTRFNEMVEAEAFYTTSGGEVKIEANLDHTGILNIGSNTHAAIDTHIADSTLHFTEASIDHGSIGGLTDDDHTQYTLADGTRAFSGNVDFGGNDLTGIGLITGDNFVTGSITAEAFYTADGGEVTGSITVREVDSSPNVSGVTTIVVTNGTLTDDGGGQVTITTGGGGGGSARFNDVTAEGFYVQGGGELDATGLLVADGTAALPAISFVSDPDTGIYRPAANKIAFTVNGVQEAEIDGHGFKVENRIVADAFYFTSGGEVTVTPIVLGGDVVVSSCLAKMAVSLSTTSGVAYELTWDALYGTDPDGWSDIGGTFPKRLTVPAGLGITHVNITMSATWSANTVGRRGMRLLMNGSAFLRDGRLYNEFIAANSTSGVSQTQTITRIPVVAGDYFEQYALQDSGSTFNVIGGTGTWMSIQGIASGSGQRGSFNTVTAEGFYVQGGGEWDNTGIQVADGTAAAPSMSFVSDNDTGIYSSAANALSLTAAGTLVATVSAAQVSVVTGSVGTPPITFIGDTDTGIYRPAANELAISVGGAQAASFRPDSFRVSGIVEAEAFYHTLGGEAPRSYVENFTAATEWTVGHNLNRQSFICQAYKSIGTMVIPDTIDVSDPNTAYFYFFNPQAGKAVILGVG